MKLSGLLPLWVPPLLFKLTVYGARPPVRVTVTTAALPAHTEPPPLTTALMLGQRTVMAAVAVALSTVASALPAPGVLPAVKVALAMPED